MPRPNRLRGNPIGCLNLEPLEDRELLSTCHVTRLADANVGKGQRGTLRYCIQKSNDNPGPDSIDFKVTGTIYLTSKLPDLASDITLTGPGADLLRVDGSAQYRVFTVSFGATVAMSGLTVTG